MLRLLGFTLTNRVVNLISGLLIVLGLVGLATYFVPFWSAQQAHGRRSVNLVSTPTAAVTSKQRVKSTPTLTIPVLGVKALIFEDVPTTHMWAYDKVLNQGVAQMAGTAALSAQSGTTLIFGHSDTRRLIKNGYDTMFATLDQMKLGDSFYVSDGLYQHTVVVDESKKIDPNDTGILASGTNRKFILLTCWPLGLPLARWVVIGHEVSRS